jgi:hypothetical protein
MSACLRGNLIERFKERIPPSVLPDISPSRGEITVQHPLDTHRPINRKSLSGSVVTLG